MLLPVNAAEQEVVEAILAPPARGAGSGCGDDDGPAVTASGKLADVVVLCGETG